jgi:cyanate permease
MGVWLGGFFYDLNGDYDVAWKLAIVLSIVAAALHWFINEAPVKRTTPAQVEA